MNRQSSERTLLFLARFQDAREQVAQLAVGAASQHLQAEREHSKSRLGERERTSPIALSLSTSVSAGLMNWPLRWSCAIDGGVGSPLGIAGGAATASTQPMCVVTS